MDDHLVAIQVDHIDGEAHGQSMNAPARNNPEAAAFTEVTGGCSQQTAEARPVRVGKRQRGRQVGLPRLVESL